MQKPSFFDTIKQFFNDIPQEDVLCNEASRTMPRIKSKSSQSTTQTGKSSDPNIFKIDNDDEGNQVYHEEEDDQESQTMNEIHKEYQVLQLYNFKQVGKPLENGYQKKQVINFPPASTFKVIKPIKTQKSLIDYLSSETERYLALDGGWIYFFQLIGKDKFQVSSSTSLLQLNQILIKKNENKPTFRLIFNTRQIKRFYMTNPEQKDLFFLKLKTECQKHGRSFNL